MAEETRHDLEEIGTAAHLMMEVVDKASQDLEVTVKSSADYLQSFNQTLAQNFTQQLTRMVENSARATDKGVEELQARKEDFVERLMELEQTEIETLVRVGKEVRQEIDSSLRNAVAAIALLVEEQIDDLRPIAMDQHENFSSLMDKESEDLNKVAEEGIINISSKENLSIKKLSQRVQEFEDAAAQILIEKQQKLLAKMQTSNEQLEEKVDQVKSELNEDFEKDKNELEQRTTVGTDCIASAGQNTIKRLSDEVVSWQSEMTQIAVDFKQLLSNDRDSFDQIHKTKIERQVDEVKGEIKTIGEEAQGRLSASHKLFQGSLRRLEKKYYERLERLLQQFESAIAQETRMRVRPDLPIETRRELKELLNTRLKARGLEIVKAFKRQVELYDLEHARFVGGCGERLETVHAASKDSLEQQLKTMNAEIERMLRGFKVELSQLDLQMPQIKDAGHAAALAVLAYKRARFSFGTD